MTMKLSEDLTNFRTDRPSEWKMDEYISKAVELEIKVAELEEKLAAGFYGKLAAKLQQELTALKEAIKAQSEPVAWRWKHERGAVSAFKPEEKDAINWEPLFTQAPTIPAGWQIVPTEPTHKMLSAFANGSIKFHVPSVNSYRLMLAAAPKP